MIWPSVEEERARALDARIGRKTTSPWRSNGIILSLVFFCLTVVGAVAFAALFQAPLFVAVVCIAVAEYLIQGRRFFGTGIESALWVTALACILFALPHSGAIEALLVIALAAAFAGARLRSAFFGTVAACLVVAYADQKWSDIWPAVAVALIIAAIAIVALMREWQRPSTEELFAFLAVAMPLAAYANPLIRYGAKPQLAMAALFAIFGAAVLAIGIMRRDRATLIGAALSLAIACFESRELIRASVEAKLIAAGALLIAIAGTIARALRNQTRGFVTTSTPASRYDEAIQLAGTFVVAHTQPEPAVATPQRESGGGHFGGAGASGDY